MNGRSKKRFNLDLRIMRIAIPYKEWNQKKGGNVRFIILFMI